MALLSAKGPGYVEMDLVYVKDGGKEEKYFAAVEAFSRLCFVRQLPDRKAASLVPVVDEMLTHFKAKSVRADMEFSAFEILNLFERRRVKVDLVPFEVRDYSRLATINRFCRSLRHYRMSGVKPGDIEKHHNREKPDHYYPHKCTADVTYEENVAVMNAKHRKGILPLRGGPRADTGQTVHVRLLKDGKFDKERPKWSRARFRVLGVFQGRYALCREGDKSGNVILRRFNEVAPGSKTHQYADDRVEESNLYVVKRIEECTDRKSNPVRTLEEANKMDCWYRVRMLDDSQVWVTANQVRFQSNEPTAAERRFFGEKAADKLTVMRATKEELAASRRKFPIMRNDQQVSFRIFFTANYNAFKARDYLVVKYAHPDQDGLPLTDANGYVKYFKPITDPKIPADGLVFGTLRYNPDNGSYDIDWSQSTVSDDPQPADMLIPEPVEIRVKKAKQSRILKSVTPTEKALSSATLDSRSKTRITDESSKTDDQREAEVVVMNVAIPAPESYAQDRKVHYEESVQTYASRMADVPDTPLGTIVSCNAQLTPNVDTPPEQQKPKEKRYKLTPRGRVIAVRSDRLEEPAPLWVPDGIRTLPLAHKGDDTADNLFLTPTRVVDGQRFTYWNPSMKFYLRKYNEDNVMGSDTSFPPSQSSQDPSSSTTDDLSSEIILVADPTGGAVPYFENNEQRDKFIEDLRKKPGAYAKIQRSLGRKTYGALVQADYDNREHIREMLEESSIERDILIDGSVIHLPDEPDTPDSTTQDGSENIDNDSNISEPRGLTSQLRVVHTASDVEEITVDDEGGMDEDPADGETVIEDIIEEEEEEDDNLDDVGGATEPPNQNDVVTPDTPNDLVPPNNQDPVLDPEPVIPKRAHVRPFKSHFEPGYDTATGDLVWKVRLGFDGAFDSFEDYVRVFTDAICKRVQEEAYMASQGRMVVDPKEIIDGLAMLAQKRLYFRSNPGYVYYYWDHCSPRLRRLFQPPHYFRDHYSRHLYWYLVCATANSTELKDDTYRILIGRHGFPGRAEDIVVISYDSIIIPGNSFFNPMMIEIRDENDELYELETPYIVEWTFTPLRAA